MVEYEGCFADSVTKRDLNDQTLLKSPKMTHKMCFDHCRNAGYKYMGLQVNNDVII